MNKPELLTRSITGLFIGAVSLSAIIYSPWTYLIWLCVIVYLGTREYFRLGELNSEHTRDVSFPALLMFIVGGAGYALIHQTSPIPVLLFLPVIIGLRFLLQLLFVKDVIILVRSNNAKFSAAAYIGIPALCGCLFLKEAYIWQYVLIPVVLIWTNDIGAYLIGSQWGKRKIAPSISPGKSIEGTVGGGLAALLTGYLTSLVWPEIPIYYIATLSLATPIFALAGDLWESALKRNAGVKDSGNLLPGHGGILDRYDSLLFVLPVAALAYAIFVL
ncbi:MAG: phosphatidate cytidylyltransferase [Saprospiraceae bacterium]|nr:phosphatidate cytidylyltransferase [Candidatus Opimibacter iunctus]